MRRGRWLATGIVTAGIVACGAAGPTSRPTPIATTPSSSASTSAVSILDAGAPADPTDGPLSALPYTPSLDRDAMNPAADPCASLYDYACGGWMKRNPIPADQSAWNVYSKLGNDNRRFLWGILDGLSKGGAERTPNQQRLGDAFAACMDQPAIDKAGVAPIQASLDAIDKVATIKDLAPLLAKLQSDNLGFDDNAFLFGLIAQQDYADAKSMIAGVNAGGLGLPDRDYYTKTDAHSAEVREQYRAHIAKMLTLLGEPAATAATEATTILELETALAKASLTRTDKRDPKKLFHKLKVADLEKATPSFDWKSFLGAVGLSSVKTVNLSEPAFMKALEDQLKTRPLGDWKAYLRWHLVHARARFLSQGFEAANFDFFSHTLRGVPAMKPRWKRCVALIDDTLGEALGEEFVRRTFTPDTKARVVDMTARIEKAMEANLKTLDWMSPATKQQALAKLHAMVNKIGYPDRTRDYSALSIKRDDFAGNMERSLGFEFKRWMAKVDKPVDRGEWFMTPPTVNAYYDAQMNDMNFPAGVLQPPLFDVKEDDAPNYGNTGATIGHELTHGFDDEGRQFDAKGDLRDWWTPADAKAFGARAKCVVTQYGSYTVVDDIKINSELSQGEDIADLGGTMLAYAAWRDAEAGKKLEPIDGLSPDQRFFIGMAQWTCENQRPENLRADALTNPHSPGRYRIDGVALNMPEYERAFSCKPGAPMAPAKRCRVW